eukprot:TRINITY_DN6689_c0_g1_i2.p1 TRINITY_DN6689_c0_g1~~TRINITY_DN6689_c0_g1_i2.p1  ORF type:complete len:497 (+),score=88.14 TRINITY_DN6689_c0_g1_i2:200-1690(+)
MARAGCCAGCLRTLVFYAPPVPYSQDDLTRQELLDSKLKSWVPGDTELQAEGHWVQTPEDLQIPLVHITDRSAGPEQDRITIIYSHANGEDLSRRVKSAIRLSEQTDCDVVTYEYPGYGLSQTQDGVLLKHTSCCGCTGQACRGWGSTRKGAYSASEERTRDAITAAFEWLTVQQGRPTARVALYGCSLGTAVTADLAARLGSEGVVLHAVVLMAPFESIIRTVLTDTAATTFGMCDLWMTCERVADISAPLLIVHGTLDAVCPFHHGYRLYRTAQEAEVAVTLLVAEGVGHQDLLEFEGMLYKAEIRQYLYDPRGFRHPSAYSAGSETEGKKSLEELVELSGEGALGTELGVARACCLCLSIMILAPIAVGSLPMMLAVALLSPYLLQVGIDRNSDLVLAIAGLGLCNILLVVLLVLNTAARYFGCCVLKNAYEVADPDDPQRIIKRTPWNPGGKFSLSKWLRHEAPIFLISLPVMFAIEPVSYTHLTLPTKRIV